MAKRKRNKLPNALKANKFVAGSARTKTLARKGGKASKRGGA